MALAGENAIVSHCEEDKAMRRTSKESSGGFGRRVRQLLVAFVLVFLSLGTFPHPASADSVRFTSKRLNLRAAPSRTAERLTLIPRGTRLEVGDCEDGWCAVTFRGASGFVASRYLSERPTARPITAGRGYINSQGYWVPSPTRTADGAPPPGATAQCCDGTYSFSMSRRGTCSHHGGVCRWLE